jgi:hypothetical protein
MCCGSAWWNWIYKLDSNIKSILDPNYELMSTTNTKNAIRANRYYWIWKYTTTQNSRAIFETEEPNNHWVWCTNKWERYAWKYFGRLSDSEYGDKVRSMEIAEASHNFRQANCLRKHLDGNHHNSMTCNWILRKAPWHLCILGIRFQNPIDLLIHFLFVLVI